MNFKNLPDDVLVNIFAKYLNLKDLLSLHKTCLRFYNLINDYDLANKYLKCLPLVDYSYPNGYIDYNYLSKDFSYSSMVKYGLYLKWYNNKFKRKLFYSFKEKMLPHIQLDLNEQNLYISEANELVCIKLNEIYNYEPSKFHQNKLHHKKTKKSTQENKNDIKINSILRLFDQNDDIFSFVKKNNVLVNFTRNEIVAHLFTNNNETINLAHLEEYSLNNKIQCSDFTTKNSDILMVYGCSNGYLKIYNIKTEEQYDVEKLNSINLQDRILRCALSPKIDNIAVGTAGVRPYENEPSCPLRIYDIERLKEIQILKPPNKAYKHGAGILALSYIDDYTLVGAGYDTFIRVYDLRTNKCVQEIEEPEDMSIYCVCVSKSYGLVSGNDRQSIIRYFDRRKAQLIHSYSASNSNSSIYSMCCTPESIFAGWDEGVTIIDFV